MDKGQVLSYELSFTGGKMRTAAQDTAFQILLRNYSEEVRGESGYIVLLQRAGSLNIKRLSLLSFPAAAEAEAQVHSRLGSTHNPLPWPRKALLLEV